MFYGDSLLTFILQAGKEAQETGVNERMGIYPSSAQLRESTAEFECHLPLAYLLPLPTVNQQLTACSSENTFYLLIHCPFLDSFPRERGRLTLPPPWPLWPEAMISQQMGKNLPHENLLDSLAFILMGKDSYVYVLSTSP